MTDTDTSLNVFGDWSDDDLKDQLAGARGRSTSAFYKLKSGKNVLRFLPPLRGMGAPLRESWKHWVDGPDGKRVSVICPAEQTGDRCPLCARLAKIAASGNAADAAFAEDCKPSGQGLAYVLVRGEESDGPRLLQMSYWAVYKKLLEIREDPDLGGDFTDPRHGSDVIIVKTGSGFSTRYEVHVARAPSPLTATEIELAQRQKPLDRYLKPPTREKMAEALECLPSAGAPTIDVTPSRPAALPNGTGRRAATAAADLDAVPVDDDDEIPW